MTRRRRRKGSNEMKCKEKKKAVLCGHYKRKNIYKSERRKLSFTIEKEKEDGRRECRNMKKKLGSNNNNDQAAAKICCKKTKEERKEKELDEWND